MSLRFAIPPGWNIVEAVLYFLLLVLFILPLSFVLLCFEVGIKDAAKIMWEEIL